MGITTITISRQTGSGGTYIGYLAAKQLGFRYLDREILRQTADKMGMKPQMLEKFEERSVPLMERIINAFWIGAPEIPAVPVFRTPIYNQDLFALESDVIKRIAAQGKSVITGRGGFFILRDMPETLHVLVHAPLEYRVKRIMKEKKIAEKDARDMVLEADRSRAKFIRDMTGSDWTDARNFHLSVNTGIFNLESCVKMITELVEKNNDRTDVV